MKIVYATDIHGNKAAYERLLKAGESADAVVIGGDTSPGFEPSRQRAFFESYLIPRLNDFRKTGKPVFFILGNDDYASNLDVIEAMHQEGIVEHIHNRTVKSGGYFFAGYTCINPGPLFIRDWIREERGIAKDLEKLKIPDPKKTVFVFHAPPYGTALDIVWNRRHVGSVAVRDFIHAVQPLLSLHGHIHESPKMSGSMQDGIGKTLCLNPGNAAVVTIDLKSLVVIREDDQGRHL